MCGRQISSFIAVSFSTVMKWIDSSRLHLLKKKNQIMVTSVTRFNFIFLHNNSVVHITCLDIKSAVGLIEMQLHLSKRDSYWSHALSNGDFKIL